MHRAVEVATHSGQNVMLPGPRVMRGSGNNSTMMCFMGNNADLPLPLSPTPQDIFAYWLLNVVTVLLCPSFVLTICHLPNRLRMWMPALVSWMPEEWMYKGSQQKVRQIYKTMMKLLTESGKKQEPTLSSLIFGLGKFTWLKHHPPLCG